MSGWYVTLHFRAPPANGARDEWPVSLLEGISAFVKRRCTLRSVCRLRWRDMYGLDANEWTGFGQQPSDLDLSSSDDNLDVVETDIESSLSLSEAVRVWPASAWTGLEINYKLLPGESGYPEMFGTCRWFVWWFRDRWNVSATLEYPMSSVGRDSRWPTWFQSFASAAAHELDLELRADDRSFDPFTVE